MKHLIMILLELALLPIGTAHAGDDKMVNLEPIDLPEMAITAELKPYALYGIGGDEGGQVGAGVALGFSYEKLIGLEAEYLWLSGDQLHFTNLNGFLRFPLTEDLEVRLLGGGGAAYAGSSSDIVVQGGIEATQGLGAFGDFVVGGRYLWVDNRDNYTLLTAGLRWEF